MTFLNKHAIIKILFLALCVGHSSTISAQQKTDVENAIFWEVSGNNLTVPSYIFGTFHLMGARYIDSLTYVKDAFERSKTMVGELLFDSTMTMKMMKASQLKNTTLDKLLSTEAYAKTASYLKELSGYDLKMFNSMNPMTIQILLMTTLQQKIFPLDQSVDIPMDMYFQQQAKKAKKKLLGLETFEVQIKALFEQFSYERQVQMLMETVNDQAKAKAELITLNKLYREQNLTRMEEMMYGSSTYSAEETAILLTNRNKDWMKKLPSLMKEQQTFIAVGALHLACEDGLVHLLRQAGYTVKPVSLN